MKNIFNLEGKVALITGASSGLGKSFAKTLSSAGATVVLSARRVENLKKLVSRSYRSFKCQTCRKLKKTSTRDW